jgi:integrase
MKPRVKGVRPMGDGIEVRFQVDGQTYRPRLPLRATAANLRHAGKVREQVMRDIAAGTFHILDHFPNYRLASKLQGELPTRHRTIAQWFEVWADVSRRNLEHSTLAIYKRHMAAYWLPVFGHLKPGQVTNEMILRRLAALDRGIDGHIALSRKTQNNIMVPLRGVFKMASRAPGAGANPCAGIDNLKVQHPAPDPFTQEEVDLALVRVLALNGEAWRDWFEFAAYAGLRTSEQTALLLISTQN